MKLASIRQTAWLAGLVITFGPVGVTLAAAAPIQIEPKAGASPVIVAQISEEDVPAAGGASPAAGAAIAPGAASPAAAATPGALGNWQQVPSNGAAQDGEEPQSGSAAQGSAVTDSTMPNGAQAATGTAPSVIPAVSSASPPTSGASLPPPALDATATITAPDPSETSLDNEIKTAHSPSLSASLQLTEQARRQIAAGGTDEAIRTLARAISIEPANPYAYFYLGRAYMAKRNYAQAITFLKRAEIGLGSSPDWYGTTLSYEGACYEVLGKNMDAARAYQRALAVAPNNLMARVGYGRLGALLTPPVANDTAAAASADQAEAGPPIEGPAPPPPAQPSPGPAAADDE
jgi:tetratricopeptide (TPR) repeat protein